MSALVKSFSLLTAEEYLQQERAADFKSDYVNGQIIAMAGASVKHNQITGNVLRHLGNKLADRPCQVFGSDLKVRIDKANVFRYPDVSALCGPMLFHDGEQDGYCNPSVIVEVLSPSTERLDRGEKFTSYRLMDSLREYILIRQDHLDVEVFSREPEGRWISLEYDEPKDSFFLRSIGCTLTLAEIYEKVTFD